MSTNKARFSINASLAEDRGYEAISAQVLTLTLEDATDVQYVRYQLYDANESLSPLASLNAPDLTFVGGVHEKLVTPADGSTTITMVTNGAETHTWLIRATATTDTGDHVYERLLALKNGKPRKTIPSESQQWGERGWSDAWNELVDYVTGVIGGGGYTTFQDEGVSLAQRNTVNFVGAGVTVTDAGGITVVTIPGSNVVGSAVGQTQRWDGSAWQAGALDLADADAVTGALPAGNGGTGIAGAGGTANRVLTTTNGSTWAAGLVALATMVSGQLPLANLVDGSATSVLGRAAGTVGVMAPIAASADGQVLRMAAGVLAFGALDLADADGVTGLLPFANIADGSATSLFGRSAGTAGVMASIAASADGQVLRRSAGALAFGALDLADSDAVTGLLPFANLTSGSAASLFGRSAASTGVMASIASTADGQVLRRSGTTLSFGALNLAGGVNAVTGLLPFANIANGSALSVFGRSANTSGVMASIVGTDGQVLRVSGTTLGFGTIGAANIGDGTITLAKLADGTAASLVGRSAATTGVYADIVSSADGQVLRRAGGVLAFGAIDLADGDAVTGLLPFANITNGSATSVFGRDAGTAGVMASIAASADGQVLQRAAGALTWASVGVGSLAGGSAVGQVLVNTVGNVPAWSAVDLADTDAVTGLLAHANLANLAGLSVFGRGANTSGVMAAITGTDGQALRVSGTTLGFGTIATAGIGDAQVTLAKLANATAASLLGRSANSTGAYADIASSADGQVLRRSSGALAFGALDLADADAVTGALAFSNMPTMVGLSVLGRSANTTGVMAAITGTDGQVLRVTGPTLSFGQIATAGIGASQVTLAKLANGTAASVLGRSAATGGVYGDIASSADGQVLRRAAGILGWGALDLADSDAVTGLLPGTNVNPNFGAQTVQSTGPAIFTGITNHGAYAGTAGGNPVATLGDIRLANGDSTSRGIQFADVAGTGTVRGLSVSNGNTLVVGNSASTCVTVEQAGEINFLVAGTRRFEVSAIALNIEAVTLRWRNSVVNPAMGIDSISTAAGVGTTTTLYGQDSTGTGATVGGTYFIRAGNAVNGTGGALTLSSGSGSSAANAGAITLAVGGTSTLTLSSTVTEIFTPTFRFDTIVAAPGITQQADATAAVTGQQLLIEAQGVTGTGATVGGILLVRGGVSTNGTGGGLDMRSGSGATATQAGNTTIRVGATAFIFANGALEYPTTGLLRSPHNVVTIAGRDTGGTNRNGVRFGQTANNVWTFGDTNNVSELFGSAVHIGLSTPMLEIASLTTNREVLSILQGAALTTTQMPTNTGDKVVYWSDATTMPTSGFPTGGGILGVDTNLGLEWKGKNGVETTIAPHGDSGNTTKRRMIDWKSQAKRTSMSSSGTATIAEFDVAALNGQAVTTGRFKVVGHYIATGSGYAQAGELMAYMSVSAGVPTVGSIQDHAAGAIANGGPFSATAIDASGTTVRFQATCSPVSGATEVFAFFEVMEFEP